MYRKSFRRISTMLMWSVAGLMVSVIHMTLPAAAQGIAYECDGDAAGRPWADGVPEEDQAVALAFYHQGTERIRQLQFAQAVKPLRKALKYWDHPGIHYNLALALDTLGETLDAYQHAGLALRHRGAALQASECKQAHVIRQRLRRLLGEVRITCIEPGGVIKLNGQPICEGPGKITKLVTIGAHQLDITAPGFTRRTEEIELAPEQTLALRVTRKPPIANRWLSYAGIGGGLAIGGMGLLLHQYADDNFTRYDAKFSEMCADGCRDEDSSAPTKTLTKARWQQGIAIGSYIMGGLLTAGGIVVAILRHQKNFDLVEQSAGTDLTLSPSLSQNSTGISISGNF